MLTESQRLAVSSREEITYVVAGPGTGKTSTLIARIVAAIREGADPSAIMALTFTNAAASEFASRLSALNIRGLGYCGTLHGFCFRMLQQYGARMGYNAGKITLLTEEQRATFLRAATGRVKPKMTKKEFMAGETDDAKQVRAEFLHTMKHNNAIDFDNLLTAAKILMLMNGLDWSLHLLIVDEVQDSAEIDWEIYDLLKAEMKMFIGDPDQSLFAFRGGKPGTLIERAHAFDSKTVLLEDNFRSTSDICNAANRLIAHNQNRVQKWSISRVYSDDITNVVAWHHKDEREEVDKIRARMEVEAKRGTPWEEMAVLTRNNDVADTLRAGLRVAGLPVKQPPASALPDDWPRCMAAAAFLHDPENMIAAHTWLLFDHDPGEVENWCRIATANKQSLAVVSGTPYTASAEVRDYPKELRALRVSEESVAVVAERIGALPPGALPADLLQDLHGCRTWVRGQVGDGITVTTIHQSKGREWDCVVVAGLEETRLPKRFNSLEELEEERRIMFVAMSRARRLLCLSSSRTRVVRGGSEFLFKSRFVEEAGIQEDAQ